MRSSPAPAIGRVSLHFNKGLAGAPASEIAAARDTAMNPAVLDAFALAIIAGAGRPAFPGVTGHEPELDDGPRQRAGEIDLAMGRAAEGRHRTRESYVSESDFFEPAWPGVLGVELSAVGGSEAEV